MATSKYYAEQGFINLHTLVIDLIADQRLTNLWRYVWYLHYMMGGYRRLVMSTIPLTQEDFIEMDKSKTIAFPKDFLGLMRLGRINGDRIEPLDRDPTIKRRTDADTRYVPRELNERHFDFINIDEDIRLDSWVGAGHNRVGYYDINLQKRRFEFSVDTVIKTGEKVYIEYVSDGCGDMNTETKIYAPIAETLKAYAVWRWNYFLHGAASPKTEAERINYLRELAEFKANTSDLDRNSIVAALQRTATTNPRW